jgi:hypothetical protein
VSVNDTRDQRCLIFCISQIVSFGVRLLNFLFPERERGRLGLHLYNETEPPVQHHFLKKM